MIERTNVREGGERGKSEVGLKWNSLNRNTAICSFPSVGSDWWSVFGVDVAQGRPNLT